MITREPIILRPIRDTDPTLLRPLGEVDPRVLADPQALVLASRNAYPVVVRPARRADNLGLAAGAVLALMLGGLTFWSMNTHRTAPLAQRVVPPPAPGYAPRAPVQQRQPVAMPLVVPLHPPVSLPTVAQGASPAMVFDDTPAPTTAKPATPGTTPAASANENDQFALRIGGSNDVETAEKMSDPATTVVQGTLIPAVLETAIDTDLPGYVRAIVSRDVRSFDGSQVLVPRSSRLIGQYKSGLQAGQTRAFVIWTRLIRPDGVSVALGSPAVDYSGSAGLGGKVDGHFMKRFGSALLLSVVGGLSSIGNAAVVISGGQSVASVAAQRDMQIAPTVKVPQGQPIRVFTARDLDFSTASQPG
jgi:type IV secretion system protein VirB10